MNIACVFKVTMWNINILCTKGKGNCYVGVDKSAKQYGLQTFSTPAFPFHGHLIFLWTIFEDSWVHNDQACEYAQVSQLLPSSLLVSYNDDSIVKCLHRLLFQGTQNGFPGPTWWLTASVNPLSSRPNTSTSTRNALDVLHTVRQNTHTPNIKKNILLWESVSYRLIILFKTGSSISGNLLLFPFPALAGEN